MGPTLLTRQTVPVPADPIQRLLADPPALPVRDGLAGIAAALAGRGHRRGPGAAGDRQDDAGPAGRRRAGERPRGRHPAPADRGPRGGPTAGPAAGRAGRPDRRLLRARGPAGRRGHADRVRDDRRPAAPAPARRRAARGDRGRPRRGARAPARRRPHARAARRRARQPPADLLLVAMSATVEAERTAALLRQARAVVTVPGALHPVAEVWCPPPAGCTAQRRPRRDAGVPRPRRRMRTTCAGRAGRRRPGVRARRGRGVGGRRAGWPAWTPTYAPCTAGCPPGSRTSR